MSSSRIQHQPALDGLRAVAVTLVLLFHLGFGWMSAGYLGVSVFFTLSGFLITSLLVREHDRTGRIAVADFYGRRVRRLLPASVVCIVGIVVAAQFGAFATVPHLRRDLWAAALQVFNWVQLTGTTSYADLFAGAGSPLDHFWSLSVEEQCYWLWPVAVLLVLRWVPRRRLVRVMGAVVVATSALAVVVAQVWGGDAAYWSTPARLPEVVIGGFVACLVERGHRVPDRASWAALPSLVAVVALSVALPSGSGPAYEGALPVFAVVSATLVWSLQVPGAVRRALSWRPLVWIGSISYGIYLFHWPVFVVLRERGWHLDRGDGAVVALAITLSIATVSSRLVERPVRVRAWAPARSLALGAAATFVAVSIAFVVDRPSSGFAVDETALQAATISPAASLEPLAVATSSTTTIVTTMTAAPFVASKAPAAGTTSTTTVAATTTTTTTTVPLTVALPAPPVRPVRVLVVGDSTAAALTVGLAGWAADHPDLAQVSSRWCAGCGFVLDGHIDTAGLGESQVDSQRQAGPQLLADVARLQPDVVVLMSTLTDVADRTWNDAEGRIGPTDPRSRERLEQAYDEVTMRLVAAGVSRIVWIVPPVPIAVLNGPEMNEPDRYAVQHEVIADVVATFGSATVRSVDVDGWVRLAGHDGDRGWRPDGVHLTDDAAREVAEQYLGPMLVTLATG